MEKNASYYIEQAWRKQNANRFQHGNAVISTGFYQWLVSSSWLNSLMTDKLQSKLNRCKSSKEKKHLYVPWKLHIRNRNDKIFKYLNQDIRGNVNNINLQSEENRLKINWLSPTHTTLCMCGRYPIPVGWGRVGYADKSVWWMPWH